MSWLLRAVFAVLVVLGLACQARSVGRARDARDDGLAASMLVGRLAQRHVAGLVLAGGAVAGRAPDCPLPVVAAFQRIDGATDANLPPLPAGDFTERYVFLGAVMSTRSRLDLALRRDWAEPRYDLGMRAVPPPRSLVAVALPRACPRLLSADWSVLSPAHRPPSR